MFVKFVIAALLIFGGVMAYKNYQEGGFANIQSVDTPAEQDVERH